MRHPLAQRQLENSTDNVIPAQFGGATMAPPQFSLQASTTTPTSPIQTKRAVPNDENAADQAKYTTNAQEYQTCLAGGTKILDKLQASNEGRLERGPISQKLAGYARDFDEFYMQTCEPSEEHEKQISCETTNKKDTLSSYENDFDPENQAWISKANYHSEEPELNASSQSEIMWRQYQGALEHHNQQPENDSHPASAQQLRTFEIQNITNPTTQAVIWMVYDWGEDMSRPKTVEAGSDDFKALIGTPNGKSKLWMLIDHAPEFGPKAISKIDIQPSGEEMGMQIHLENSASPAS